MEIIEKCIVCEDVILRKTNKDRARKKKDFRQKNAVTCSPKCAKIYYRVRCYSKNKFEKYKKEEVLKLKKEIEELKNETRKD